MNTDICKCSHVVLTGGSLTDVGSNSAAAEVIPHFMVAGGRPQLHTGLLIVSVIRLSRRPVPEGRLTQQYRTTHGSIWLPRRPVPEGWLTQQYITTH